MALSHAARRLAHPCPRLGLVALSAIAWAYTAPAQAQVAELPVYDDAPLAAGWQNWSWATVDVASTLAVHGGATSIAVYAGPWTALALRHDAFDTTGHGNVSFWINGGPNGQQRLAVAATLNDVGQPPVTIGPIAANSWQHVTLPLAALNAENVTNFTGLWFQEFTGTDQSQNPFFVDEIVLTAAVPTLPPPPLDGGIALYGDSFTNGWENWSWASVDPANSSPVNTGRSSIAVTAGPGEALRFHHQAIDTEAYESVTFWIHGGATGGQMLSLNALLDDVVQAGYPLGPLVANTWQKLTVPLASLGAANQPNLTDIWLQDSTGAGAPTFYVDDVRLDLAPAPDTVIASVDAKRRIRRVDPRTFGINAAIWDGVFDTETTVDVLTEMGNQALRFPGGSISDTYHWKTGTTEGQTTPWATSFDAFAATALATAAQVYLTVNYGTGSPEEAADWVRYSNVEKGYGFEYWEIGNENYGSWEADQNVRPHDPVTYATRFVEYARQMKAVDPAIKVGAVLLNSEDAFANYADEVVANPRTGASHSGWSAVMLATFQQLRYTPDFVVYHRYEQGPGGENDAYLLGAARSWANDAAAIRQMLDDYLGKRAKRVELACTETNSVYASPGKQTTSLVNGLFLADVIGNVTKTEVNALLWWNLRNAQEVNNASPSLYGWRGYGDYGVVSYADPAGAADRYPTFYVRKLLTHYATGGETVVEASSSYNGLGVYAVRDNAERSLNILMINKYPLSALDVTVSVDGFEFRKQEADVFSYGIPQDEAARTGSGSADVAQTTLNVSGSGFAYTPGPYSATVIQIHEPGCETDPRGHGVRR